MVEATHDDDSTAEELADQLDEDVAKVNKAYAPNEDVVFAEVLQHGLSDLREWCEERGFDFGTWRYDGFHKSTYRIEV